WELAERHGGHVRRCRASPASLCRRLRAWKCGCWGWMVSWS
ncbi:hypothetical protein, partial [Methylomonas albis]